MRVRGGCSWRVCHPLMASPSPARTVSVPQPCRRRSGYRRRGAYGPIESTWENVHGNTARTTKALRWLGRATNIERARQTDPQTALVGNGGGSEKGGEPTDLVQRPACGQCRCEIAGDRLNRAHQMDQVKPDPIFEVRSLK